MSELKDLLTFQTEYFDSQKAPGFVQGKVVENNNSEHQGMVKVEFTAWEEKADIVITHGGTGAIIGAVKKGKKVIAVPRLAKYGEHVDDHQIQLIAQFKGQNLICGLDDATELEDGLKFVKEHEFDAYRSNTKTIIESIERFIEG